MNSSVIWIPHMGEEPDRFRLYRQSELPSVQSSAWVVKGVIPLTGVGVIFGPTKAFKTFVAIDLGAHLANGMDRWFGFRIKQTCEVIYVPLEGRGSMQPRSAAWCLHHQKQSTGIHYLLDGVDLQKEEEVDALIDQINRHYRMRTWQRPAFVIIDTLARAAAGLDENGSEMGKVLAAGQRIARAIYGVVCFVAHPGHSSPDRLRGWSGMPAGFDFSLRIDVRGKRERTLVVDKVKDGEDDQRINFGALKKDLGEDEDKELVTSLVVLPEVQFGGAISKPDQAKAEHAREEAVVLAWIKDQLEDDTRSSGSYLEGCRDAILPGVSQAKMRDCISRLVGRGALAREGKGKDAWLRPTDCAAQA